MKNYLAVLLAVVIFLVSPIAPGACSMPVLADGPIAQGITVRVAPVYVSDAQGWHQIGTVPPGTKVGIYWFDSNWVKNDPNQWMRRSDVRIYGVDADPVTQYGSPVLGQAGQPIQVGEVVYAKDGCRQYPGFWEGPYFRPVAAGTKLKVMNRQDKFLFVQIGDPQINNLGWVKETSAERKLAQAPNVIERLNLDRVAVLAFPITNHLAGNGRAIPVTLAEAETAVKAVLQGAGTLYTRADGRIMFEIIRNGHRFVGFLNNDGSLGSYFPPAERHQLIGQVAQAEKYIRNVVERGGYWRISYQQVPLAIKLRWFGDVAKILAGARVATESFLVMFIIPRGYFPQPNGSVTN